MPYSNRFQNAVVKKSFVSEFLFEKKSFPFFSRETSLFPLFFRKSPRPLFSREKVFVPLSMVPARVPNNCFLQVCTLRTVIVGGGGYFRNLDFFPSISIYYNPPNLRFWKNYFWSSESFSKNVLILLNSCSFWPKIDFFLSIFHLPPFIMTPPIYDFLKFADPP
jgi:hypothetical protein